MHHLKLKSIPLEVLPAIATNPKINIRIFQEIYSIAPYQMSEHE